MNVEHFGALDPMRCVELAEGSFAPDVQLSVSAQGGGERTSSHFDHTAEREFFEEGGQSTAFRRVPSTQLALSIRTEGENFTFLRKHNCVLFTTGCLGNFVW